MKYGLAILMILFLVVAIWLFMASGIVKPKTQTREETEEEYFTRLLVIEADKRQKNRQYMEGIEAMAENKGISVRQALLMRVLHDIRYSNVRPQYKGAEISGNVQGRIYWNISEGTIK